MRIFYSSNDSDPMLMDTKAGLHTLYRELQAFINSSATVMAFPAVTTGNPQPYAKFLSGLRLVKGTGEAQLSLSSDGWLVLEGSVEELGRCITRFLIEEEDGHTHLYTAPVSLIIESDSERSSELAS